MLRSQVSSLCEVFKLVRIHIRLFVLPPVLFGAFLHTLMDDETLFDFLCLFDFHPSSEMLFVFLLAP